jgi:replicative DNA helicase
MTADEEPATHFFDIDIEQALLGALMIDEKAIARASAGCEPDDFYDPTHQTIADFIFRSNAEGHAVTPLTVKAALRTDPGLIQIAQAGNTEDPGRYLFSLARACPAMPNIEDYCRIIADLRAKRDANDAMAYAKDLLADGEIDTGTALGPLIEVYDRAQARGRLAEDSHSIGEASAALLREAEDAERRGERIAVPTGLSNLDDVIGGFYPENLIIAGGRPGMGKSVLAWTFAKAAALAGWSPHFFSLEMAKREVSARAIAEYDYEQAIAAGKKPLAYNSLLHRKGLTADEWDRAIAAQGALSSLPIEVCDRGKLNINQIAGLSRARASRGSGRSRGPFILIDHLQIIAATDRQKNRNRNDEIAEMTGGGKQLAKRLSCPVVILSQLRREVDQRDDKHPQISDFREGGSIEQDADILIGLYRPFYYAAQAIRSAKTQEAKTNAESVAEKQKNLLEMELLKNRNGPTKTVEAWIDVRSSVIRDSDPRQTKDVGADLLDYASANQQKMGA